MFDPFGHVHLDPASDPPERYRAMFDLCGELWGRLQSLRSRCSQDEFLMALIEHLQRQMIGVMLILSKKVESEAQGG